MVTKRVVRRWGKKKCDKCTRAPDINIAPHSFSTEHVIECGETPSVSSASLSTDKVIMQFCTNVEIGSSLRPHGEPSQ
jgi:hypothetical protein